ncbi:TetR/AcrR family transcriptional regulator [Nocardioides sp. SYSU DS0651]|uniref:TetR/AcrR family transcriptional regulator n=1 Tax=Nocardioides sp. SYSU DS0651 TaxID=3415955 RepID=UPI003F4B00E9
MADPSSPSTGREAKRHQTSLRLQQCAVRLTLDKGFDGWTMDDLAEAAEVSRRTAFNYFDSKTDVVLGPRVELDPARVEVFVAGGPTGNLLDDVLALAADVIEEHGQDQDAMAAGRKAVLSDARLLAVVHERFEVITADFVEHMHAREGARFDEPRARLLTRLVVMIFDAALERAEAAPGRPFAEHFSRAVADARAVLT